MYWTLIIASVALLVFITALFIIIKNIDYIHRTFKTLPRDFEGAKRLFTLEYNVQREMRRQRGINEIFLENVRLKGEKEALFDIRHQKSYTFAQLNKTACNYANLLKSKGLQRDDTVAILMENRAETVAVWLGCLKIGAVSAWMNYNLKRDSLQKCLCETSAKAIFTTNDFAEEAEALSAELNGLPVYNVDSLPTSMPDDCAATEPDLPNPPGPRNPICLVFTSGTTGLPKAAVIKQFRFIYMAYGGRYAFGIKPNDRIYICLPMYHSSAGIMGIGQAVLNGATCIIKTKFSASSFWKDCVAYNCTVAQYIGETCKYLLRTEICSEEKQHKIRLMVGNGLRSQIWIPFKQRFRIEKIMEFYASTEGTVNLSNFTGKKGACGFLPIHAFTQRFFPVRLLKVDETSGELLRDKNGFCVPCVPGEEGIIVSTLRSSDPLLSFEGYLSEKETAKKVIKQPLPGVKAVFISGDLLFWDRLGYLYFKDRLGDTFRWKGENVSTFEVESVFANIPGVTSCAVYGVRITGYDGQAGMVSVSLADCISAEEAVNNIAKKLFTSLPRYAIPVFLRITEQIQTTGTHKMIKTQLKNESYKREHCHGDRLFVIDTAKKCYIPLSDEIEKKIADGEM